MIASRPPSPLVPFAIAACAALSACFDGTQDDVQLLVPDDVALHWDASFDGEDDGRIALVPADVMVYAADSGEPVEESAIEFFVGAESVGLVLPEQVTPTSDADDPVSDLAWDAWRDRYFDVTDADPAEALRVRTDDQGLARVYLYIDAFPGGPEAFAAIPVSVSLGDIEDSFSVVAR